jgi:hypothetical protein
VSSMQIRCGSLCLDLEIYLTGVTFFLVIFNFLFHLIINFFCADPYCLIRLEILAMLLSLETMQNIVGLPKKRKCYSMPEL